MASPLARRFLLAPVLAPPLPLREQTPLGKSIVVGFAGALCAAFLYILFPSIYHCLLDHRLRRPPQQRSGSDKRPPVSPTELCEIPVTAYGSGSGRAGEASCSVCLDDYAEGDEVRVLPQCGHVFHRECIDRWLVTRSRLCPMCRRCVIERHAKAAATDGCANGGSSSAGSPSPAPI